MEEKYRRKLQALQEEVRGDLVETKHETKLINESNNKYLLLYYFGHNSPLSAMTRQPTAYLMSPCLQTGVNDHPTSLGVAYGQLD